MRAAQCRLTWAHSISLSILVPAQISIPPSHRPAPLPSSPPLVYMKHCWCHRFSSPPPQTLVHHLPSSSPVDLNPALVFVSILAPCFFSALRFWLVCDFIRSFVGFVAFWENQMASVRGISVPLRAYNDALRLDPLWFAPSLHLLVRWQTGSWTFHCRSVQLTG
jgi:hypothetical protein